MIHRGNSVYLCDAEAIHLNATRNDWPSSFFLLREVQSTRVFAVTLVLCLSSSASFDSGILTGRAERGSSYVAAVYTRGREVIKAPCDRSVLLSWYPHYSRADRYVGGRDTLRGFSSSFLSFSHGVMQKCGSCVCTLDAQCDDAFE